MFPTLITTAVTNGTTAATSQVINLPSSGIIAGDILIAIVRNGVACTYTWPAGWTELIDASDDGDDDENTIGWRMSDGTDGTTFTVTASASGKFAGYVAQIRNGFNGTPQNATVTTGTTGTQPNSGSLSPTNGAEDLLYGTIAAWGGETTGVTSYPTNYALGNNTANSGTAGATTTNCRVAGAWRQLNASSDDPGAYTIAGTLSNWSAWTFVVRPVREILWNRVPHDGQHARLRR